MHCVKRLLLLLIALIAPVVVSHASLYVVTDAGDGSDAQPGDDACATACSACTFRAAVEEANAHSGADVIGVPEPLIIAPATLLPDLNEPLTVDALGCGVCGEDFGLEIQGNAAFSRVLLVDGAVTVRGVRITGVLSSGASSAVLVGGAGGTLECMDVDVTANTVVNVVTGASGTRVVRSRIEGAPFEGMPPGDCIQGNAATDILVQDNTVTGCEDGIYFAGATGAILNNDVSAQTHNGVHLYAGSDGVVVGGNRLHDNLESGLRIHDSDNVRVGAPAAAFRNVIAGNGANGVWIESGSTATRVEYNDLGVSDCNGEEPLRDDGGDTVAAHNVSCPTPTPAPGCCGVTGHATVTCAGQDGAAQHGMPLTTLVECQALLDVALGSGQATASTFNASAVCEGVTTPGTGTCPNE